MCVYTHVFIVHVLFSFLHLVIYPSLCFTYMFASTQRQRETEGERERAREKKQKERERKRARERGERSRACSCKKGKPAHPNRQGTVMHSKSRGGAVVGASLGMLTLGRSCDFQKARLGRISQDRACDIHLLFARRDFV